MVFKDYLTTKNIIFLIVAVLFLKFSMMVSSIVMMFFAAYVLACSLNPIVEILSKKMNRYTATAVVICGMLVICFTFLLPIIIIASKQIGSFLQVMPEHIENIKEFLLNKEFMGKKLFEMINIESLIQPVSNFTSQIVNESINITIGIAQTIIYILTICIVMYYFIVDKKLIRKTFMSLFPSNMKYKANRIIETISHKIGGYIIALGVTISSVGIIFTLCLLLLKVDYAVLLGLITTILDIIPVIGPTIALIICLLMCYQLGPITLLLITLAFFFTQWVENNFVRPYVFGKFMDIHPLLIFFGIFVAAKFFGIIGVIFAPAIVATVCVLLDELYIKPINQNIVDKN